MFSQSVGQSVNNIGLRDASASKNCTSFIKPAILSLCLFQAYSHNFWNIFLITMQSYFPLEDIRRRRISICESANVRDKGSVSENECCCCCAGAILLTSLQLSEWVGACSSSAFPIFWSLASKPETRRGLPLPLHGRHRGFVLLLRQMLPRRRPLSWNKL